MSDEDSRARTALKTLGVPIHLEEIDKRSATSRLNPLQKNLRKLTYRTPASIILHDWLYFRRFVAAYRHVLGTDKDFAIHDIRYQLFRRYMESVDVQFVFTTAIPEKPCVRNFRIPAVMKIHNLSEVFSDANFLVDISYVAEYQGLGDLTDFILQMLIAPEVT
jgi:hypothetical protein